MQIRPWRSFKAAGAFYLHLLFQTREVRTAIGHTILRSVEEGACAINREHDNRRSPISFGSPRIHASTDVKRISRHQPAMPQRRKSLKARPVISLVRPDSFAAAGWNTLFFITLVCVGFQLIILFLPLSGCRQLLL